MKYLGWLPKDIQTSLSTKRDTVLLLMLYLFNCFTFSTYTELGKVATEPWLLLAWLYGLVTLVPLFWRNKAPVAVFITQLIFVIAWMPFLWLYSPVVGVPVALYSIATNCGKKFSLPALAVSLIPNVLVAFALKSAAEEPKRFSTFVGSVGFLVLAGIGACIAGHLTRASQQHIEYLEREQAATREAEERKQAAAREAEMLAAERRKIARELHDSVSHAVTVIVLLAAGAAKVADTDLDEAKQSLGNIETTAKRAMNELRDLLAILGRGSPNDAVGTNGSGSQQGLTDLAMLLASVRATGMSVSVHLNGKQRVLAPNIDLTAYRIVQEGLTNVMKHGGKDAKPQLRIVWEADNLVIQIDNGTGLAEMANSPATSGGWGLRGLRERIHAIGGDLTAGPHREAGFRLTAILPVATPATCHEVPSVVAPHAAG
jgi:signal transduction histidine kinase